MSVYRIHLKPGADATYSEVLEFCKDKRIIGVGWANVACKVDDYDTLRQECKRAYPEDKGVFKSVNCIRGIQPSDLIWTREGDTVSKYYLCRATAPRWKDRIITADHLKYDITNYVGCEWIEVGTEDQVPGRVINSFRARLSAQHMYGVDSVSAIIWNKLATDEQGKCPIAPIDFDQFWNLIGPEELECLVMLYLQTRGYYVYSTTVKKDTKTYEGIMISKDGKHKCFPQVKQNCYLDPKEYAKGISTQDRVVLFSSTEAYGEEHPQVECLKRHELFTFIKNNYDILPDPIKYWLDFVNSDVIS